MKFLEQLDATVRHLNEILEEQGYDGGYTIEPVAGTDNFSLWLNGELIVTALSEILYTIVYALKHVQRIPLTKGAAND